MEAHSLNHFLYMSWDFSFSICPCNYMFTILLEWCIFLFHTHLFVISIPYLTAFFLLDIYWICYWDSREVSPCLISSLRWYITTVFIYGIGVVMITCVWDSLMHHFDSVVNVYCMFDWIWLHFFHCGILVFWCKLLLLYVTSILINMGGKFGEI